MQGELGDDYVLYLLEDQEEKPVAVVLPRDAAEQPLSAAQEVRLPVHASLGPARASLMLLYPPPPPTPSPPPPSPFVAHVSPAWLCCGALASIGGLCTCTVCCLMDKILPRKWNVSVASHQ